MKRTGNPTAAAVVSLIIALMGAYVFIVGTSEVAKVAGALFFVVCVLGFVANLYIRRQWKTPPRR